MSERRRFTLERSCEGKVRFPSKTRAAEAHKRLRHERAFDAHQVYHCSFCGGWHMGHRFIVDAPVRRATSESWNWRRALIAAHEEMEAIHA
ncbi:conserved protein of unknown function (plasmid) [Rhodovastum atsumiense]|uniref:Uncharacterized protein n=1 Tax=Rhodovastum atsumiense TaxID=504468 RepID=A0A5M6IVF8_9PROT|nr:hypothetical protein [Rhodovastum atsumiense]KAA5611827.1 hypothetical protein F1189_12375 [Rhodovastum atsumiense]CAH2606062.1 conserved protein of unknown function [Rhodovastum atsumiense]